MNRKQLLTNSMSNEKNNEFKLSETLDADTKFLKRSKRNLEDAIEDAEALLKARLSANTPIDESVIKNLYSNVVDLQSQLKLYTDFEKSFISTTNQD